MTSNISAAEWHIARLSGEIPEKENVKQVRGFEGR